MEKFKYALINLNVQAPLRQHHDVKDRVFDVPLQLTNKEECPDENNWVFLSNSVSEILAIITGMQVLETPNENGLPDLMLYSYAEGGSYMRLWSKDIDETNFQAFVGLKWRVEDRAGLAALIEDVDVNVELSPNNQQVLEMML